MFIFLQRCMSLLLGFAKQPVLSQLFKSEIIVLAMLLIRLVCHIGLIAIFFVFLLVSGLITHAAILAHDNISHHPLDPICDVAISRLETVGLIALVALGVACHLILMKNILEAESHHSIDPDASQNPLHKPESKVSEGHEDTNDPQTDQSKLSQ